MIVTVTLNPTLDKTLSVPVLRPGEVHRARFLRQDIGGKGINVSRALAALGVASIPIGFLGGATGRAMRDGLTAAGYDARFVDVPGETRQNLTLLDESTGVYTKINEPGPNSRPRAPGGAARAGGRVGCSRRPVGAVRQPASRRAGRLLRRPRDCNTGARRACHPRHQRGGAALGAGRAAGRHQAQQRGSGPGFGSNGIQRRGARGRGAPAVRSPGSGDASRAHRLPDARRGRAGAGCRRRVGDGIDRRRSPRAALSARAMRHWRACCGRCPMAATPPRRRAVPWRAAPPRRCRKERAWGRASLVDELRPQVKVASGIVHR